MVEGIKRHQVLAALHHLEHQHLKQVVVVLSHLLLAMTVNSLAISKSVFANCRYKIVRCVSYKVLAGVGNNFTSKLELI